MFSMLRSRYTSIKTRIETGPCIACWQILICSRYTSIKTRIETKHANPPQAIADALATLPSKQGLKREGFASDTSDTSDLSLHFHQNKD